MASKKGASVLDFLGKLEASTPKVDASKSEAESAARAADLVVALGDIAVDPERKQPRRKFDPEALRRLAEAIKEHGLIQPLVVRHSGVDAPKYYLIAGERRMRACQLAERGEVPVYLRDDLSSSAAKQYEVQVIENGNRQSLTDYEMACGLQEMIANRKAEKPGERGVKGKVADLAGISASDLSRYLSMLDADIEPLASEGILYNSEHVSMFRRLDEAVREQLVAVARERGEPIAWSELREALAAAKGAAREDSGTGGTAAAGDGGQHGGDGVDTAAAGDGGQPGGDGIGSAGGMNAGAGSSSAGGSGSTDGGSKGIKLSKLSGEKLEMLLRFFVDKASDKVDVTLPRDLAVAVLENMGIELPESVEDYATRIKDFLS